MIIHISPYIDGEYRQYFFSHLFGSNTYVSQITVLRYGVALVNECGLKQWYIMY